MFNICAIFWIFFQLVFGFLSGYMLGNYMCKKIEYRGPNSNEIRSNVYDVGNGEYVQFDVDMCLCPPSQKNLYKERLDSGD